MSHFVMLSILLLALVSSYEISRRREGEVMNLVNDASTAYASCQDALDKDRTAEDGLYFVNNHGEV